MDFPRPFEPPAAADGCGLIHSAHDALCLGDDPLLEDLLRLAEAPTSEVNA